jgi:putative glutamine amidotransferase
MNNATNLPVVLLPACNKMLGEHPFHTVGQKYVEAVRLAGAMPLVVANARAADLPTLLALADGVLLTGSASNVHPRHFGQAVHDTSLPLDEDRDAWTLPLIRAALAQGLPLLAICRGTQEANVALGGSLHQAVQEVAPHADHRAPSGLPAAQQYAPAHALHVQAGGLLAELLGTAAVRVNSVHGQAVDRLAPGLRVEARAPDGLIEAFAMPEAPAFNLCLQWHPEWQAQSNPVSMAILQAFGQACEQHRQRRHRVP